jgi:spermidine/putrescine transport system ATP-binding protein
VVQVALENVSRLPAYRRNVHTVFQDYALFPHLSVFDNVAYALPAKHKPVAEITQRVTEALKLVQLSEMAQRIAFRKQLLKGL